jgi:hypothetical protein
MIIAAIEAIKTNKDETEIRYFISLLLARRNLKSNPKQQYMSPPIHKECIREARRIDENILLFCIILF